MQNHLENTESVAFGTRSLQGLIFLGWHTLECSTRAANEIYPLMGLERITREGVAILKLSSVVTVFSEATLMSLLKTKPVCSGMQFKYFISCLSSCIPKCKLSIIIKEKKCLMRIAPGSLVTELMLTLDFLCGNPTVYFRRKPRYELNYQITLYKQEIINHNNKKTRSYLSAILSFYKYLQPTKSELICAMCLQYL